MAPISNRNRFCLLRALFNICEALIEAAPNLDMEGIKREFNRLSGTGHCDHWDRLSVVSLNLRNDIFYHIVYSNMQITAYVWIWLRLGYHAAQQTAAMCTAVATGRAVGLVPTMHMGRKGVPHETCI